MTKGNTVWAHFTVTGYFPTNIHLSGPILKESVRIETRCCIFKQMIIDWTNTVNNTESPTASAPMMPLHMLINPI